MIKLSIAEAAQQGRERAWRERAEREHYPPDRLEAGLRNLRREYQLDLWGQGAEAAAAEAAGRAASLANDRTEIATREAAARDWQSQAGVLARLYLAAYAEANLHLSGYLVFDSETGSEGGWWAFQDERFIGLPDATLRCEHCGIFPDTAVSGPLRTIRSVPLGDLGPGPDFAMPPTCDQEDPPRPHVFGPAYPAGVWSYYGLHGLGNGDRLTINDRDDPARVLWSGQIQLGRTSNFRQSIRGLWIHNRQRGVDQETWLDWFAQGLPAQLEKAALPRAGSAAARLNR
jgi:hypothetical protein